MEIGTLLSDKSRSTISHADGSVCIYHHKNERLQCCIQVVDRFYGGSIMVLGGLMGKKKTDLVIAQYSECPTLYQHFEQYHDTIHNNRP